MDEKLTQRWLKQSHRQHKENSEYFSTFLRWTSINLSSIHLLYKRFLALITISRNPSKFHDIITVYLTRELNSFEFEWYDLSIDVTHQSYRWRHNCHRLISTAIRNSKKKKKNRIANFFPIRDRIINFNFAKRMQKKRYAQPVGNSSKIFKRNKSCSVTDLRSLLASDSNRGSQREMNSLLNLFTTRKESKGKQRLDKG